MVLARNLQNSFQVLRAVGRQFVKVAFSHPPTFWTVQLGGKYTALVQSKLTVLAFSVLHWEDTRYLAFWRRRWTCWGDSWCRCSAIIHSSTTEVGEFFGCWTGWSSPFTLIGEGFKTLLLLSIITCADMLRRVVFSCMYWWLCVTSTRSPANFQIFKGWEKGPSDAPWSVRCCLLHRPVNGQVEEQRRSSHRSWIRCFRPLCTWSCCRTSWWQWRSVVKFHMPWVCAIDFIGRCCRKLCKCKCKCKCIRNWPLPIGAFLDQCKQIVINKHNLVKNPNWREADQLVIYKRRREAELGDENNMS